MGIKIAFEGKKRFYLSKWSSKEQLRDTLRELAAKFGAVSNLYRSSDYCIEFDSAGNLHLDFREGIVTGWAQTNEMGPGFHHMVVVFLKELKNRLQLKLTVDDDTGYWYHLDFETLQKAHRKWLHQLMSDVKGRQDTTDAQSLIPWMSDNWAPMEQKGTIVTPMGRFTHEEFVRAVDDPTFPERYFIWYNAERDAYYHRGVALFLMWNECLWIKPCDREEKDLIERILFHLQAARQLDAEIPLPLCEWRELATLVGSDTSVVTGPAFDKGKRIGYRREELVFPFADQWEVVLPGHFRLEMKGTGSIDYCERGRMIRLLVREYQEDGTDWLKERLEKHKAKWIEREVDGYLYQAVYWRFEGEMGRWSLNGTITYSQKMAHVLVVWHEDRSDWALETFFGLKRGTT